MDAARVVWAMCFVKNIPAQVICELTYRAAEFLELADDPSCTEFENKVLQAALALDTGSERHVQAVRRAIDTGHFRSAEVFPATYESKSAQSAADYTAGVVSWGFFAPDSWPIPEAGAREAARLMGQAVLTHLVEAGALTENRSLQLAVVLRYHSFLGDCLGLSHVPEIWDPCLCGGEASLAEAIEFYTYEEMGAAMKADVTAIDVYRHGAAQAPLVLWFGNLRLLDKWAVTVTAANKQLDFPSSRNFTGEHIEIFFGIQVCVLLFKADRPAQARSVLSSLGFDWTDGGLALLDVFVGMVSGALPSVDEEGQSVFCKLVLYLAAPQTAALDARVSAWIPEPAELALHERTHGWAMCFWLNGILSLAARVFLKLGRDDDAEETARIAVSPEHHTLRKYDKVECHTALGQVAAKRGDFEAASGHFSRGLEEARASRLPMLELLIARDWKRAVNEHGCFEIDAACAVLDAVIDAACAQMGKSREQLASVL